MAIEVKPRGLGLRARVTSVDLTAPLVADNRNALRQRGVVRAAIFGSTARGEAGPESDVDVLVDIDPTADMGVYEYVALTRFLGELFPARVDVANHATLLHPLLRELYTRQSCPNFQYRRRSEPNMLLT